jgi:hypothetical protein
MSMATIKRLTEALTDCASILMRMQLDDGGGDEERYVLKLEEQSSEASAEKKSRGSEPIEDRASCKQPPIVDVDHGKPLVFLRL